MDRQTRSHAGRAGRTWSGLAALALLGACVGCAAPIRQETVSDVRVVGLADLTGRSPGDVRSGLASRIPTMAVEMGLIGNAGQDPGKPIHLRGSITGFPQRGQASSGAGGWIVADPITVEWTVMEEDGTVIGSRTITTNPRDAIHVNDDPFVYTQARAVLLWLLGR